MRDPALYAEAVRLHTDERLGYKKIADRIGRSSQTVGNWLREWKGEQASKSRDKDLERQTEPTFRGKPLTEAKLEAFWEVYNHSQPTQGDQWDELMPALGRHVATSLAWENAHPTKSREQFKCHLLKEIKRLRL